MTTLLAATWVAHAAGDLVTLSIAPLGSTLAVKEGGKPVQEVFSLANAGDAPATFEVQLFSWEQDEVGESVLTPTDEFLVFPQTVTIQPGKTRAVRLMHRGKNAKVPKEQSYFRLQFREIPRRFTPEETDDVRVALVTRITVPLVLQNVDFKATPELKPVQTPLGLRIENPSHALLKVSAIYCGDTQLSGLRYVLPGVSSLMPDTTCSQPLRVEREDMDDTNHEIQTTP